MATLHYDLKNKNCQELFENGRWTLLTMLILHSNVRRRCWPGMDELSRVTGLSLGPLTDAKKWLIEHGAVELVPYNLRVGEEKKLPKRQHVYQLTGVIALGDRTAYYLYSPNVSETETSDSRTSRNRNLSSTSTDLSTSSKDSLAPQVSQKRDTPEPKPRPRNELFDVIAFGSFGLKQVPTTQGGRIAKVVRDVTAMVFGSHKPTPEQKSHLATELDAMYVWYKREHPNLSTPAAEATICKYLNEWRIATAVAPKPDVVEVAVPYEPLYVSPVPAT